MTKTELQDNLVFLSALKLLEQLTDSGGGREVPR